MKKLTNSARKHLLRAWDEMHLAAGMASTPSSARKADQAASLAMKAYMLIGAASGKRTPSRRRLSKRARRTDRGSSRAGRFTSRRRTSRR